MARRGRPPRAAVHQRLEEAVQELRDRLGDLPAPTEAEDIWADIWHQEAHNSTAKELSENALRVAALRGRLRATKADGGGWRSTKKWVETYKNSRYTRG